MTAHNTDNYMGTWNSCDQNMAGAHLMWRSSVDRGVFNGAFLARQSFSVLRQGWFLLFLSLQKWTELEKKAFIISDTACYCPHYRWEMLTTAQGEQCEISIRHVTCPFRGWNFCKAWYLVVGVHAILIGKEAKLVGSIPKSDSSCML